MPVIVYGKKRRYTPSLQSQVVALHLEFLMGFISLGRESFGICSHAMGVTPQLIRNRFYTISTDALLNAFKKLAIVKAIIVTPFNQVYYGDVIVILY